MTLENLLAIHRLIVWEADAAGVQRLLDAARRNLADAAVTQISAENRFDAAYKCIMQCAMAALWANGYRTPTSQPGHHQTAIQCLPKTIGAVDRTVIVLDALRKQRHLSDYEGNPVSTETVAACMKEARSLLEVVDAWLRQHRPDLL